jgi:hypothetical protein
MKDRRAQREAAKSAYDGRHCNPPKPKPEPEDDAWEIGDPKTEYFAAWRRLKSGPSGVRYRSGAHHQGLRSRITDGEEAKRE